MGGCSILVYPHHAKWPPDCNFVPSWGQEVCQEGGGDSCHRLALNSNCWRNQIFFSIDEIQQTASMQVPISDWQLLLRRRFMGQKPQKKVLKSPKMVDKRARQEFVQVKTALEKLKVVNGLWSLRAEAPKNSENPKSVHRKFSTAFPKSYSFLFRQLPSLGIFSSWHVGVCSEPICIFHWQKPVLKI